MKRFWQVIGFLITLPIGVIFWVLVGPSWWVHCGPFTAWFLFTEYTAGFPAREVRWWLP